MARLKSKWNDELAQWRSRPLDDLEVVYMWVDGVYVKAGLEKEKAAVLVVMAALIDGSKVVVSTVPGRDRELVAPPASTCWTPASSPKLRDRTADSVVRVAKGCGSGRPQQWGPRMQSMESPFAALRLRTDAAKRYKRVDRAIAVIWKMLMVAEGRFRRLKAPELIEDVYLGAQYADGIAIESTAEMVAA